MIRFFQRLRKPNGNAVGVAFDVLTLTVLGWIHGVFAASFTFAPMGFDERYFLWEGWSLAHHLVPYRDFREFKPPVIFAANALALDLFGLANMRFRVLFALLSLAGFLSLAAALLSRKVNRWLILGTFPFFFALLFDHSLHEAGINDAESIGLPFFLAGVAIIVARAPRPAVRQVVGAVLLALAPLAKEPLALPVFATWVSLLFLYRAEGDEPRAGVKFAMRTIGGVVGLLVTWLLYMLVTRSLGAYIDQVRENIIYSEQYAYSVGWVARRTGMDAVWFGWDKLHATWLNTARIGALLPLFVATVALAGRQRLFAALAALCAFFASLYAVSIGGGYLNHYFVLAIPGTIFLAVIGLIFLDQALLTSPPARRWLGASWCFCAVLAFGALLREQATAMKTYVPAAPPISQDIVSYVERETAPSDRILALGDPTLYVYANRRSATRQVNFIDELIMLYPGTTDESRLSGPRAELEASRPKLVVFNDDLTQGYGRKQRYLKAMVMPFLTANHYVKVNEKIYRRPD